MPTVYELIYDASDERLMIGPLKAAAVMAAEQAEGIKAIKGAID